MCRNGGSQSINFIFIPEQAVPGVVGMLLGGSGLCLCKWDMPVKFFDSLLH